MFNLSGSEIVIILLLALVVLGPEKLPEAVRRFGRLYGELKRMSSGFQSEFRTAIEEPLKELRETAELTTKIVKEEASPEQSTSERAGSTSIPQDPPEGGQTKDRPRA